MCAPPFIAATIYMFLGRLIRALDAERLSSIRPKWLTPIFVTNDIICFLTQIAGAGVQVTGDARVMSIGKKATLGGLIFSLVVFLLLRAGCCCFPSTMQSGPVGGVAAEPATHLETVYVGNVYFMRCDYAAEPGSDDTVWNGQGVTVEHQGSDYLCL